jgi:hypothetical protein
MSEEKTHTIDCPKLYGAACQCDGDHTFNELYEHRIRLFIEMCRAYEMFVEPGQWETTNPPENVVWCSKKHADGGWYDDWFVMGIDKRPGKQITYHIPDRFWEEVSSFAHVLPEAPAWDGHTSKDVLERLSRIMPRR